MLNFESTEELTQFLDELEFLRNNTKMSPLASAKVNHLREKNRNQREVDLVEYKYRFKFWEKLFEKEWKETKWESNSKSLYEYAHDLLIQTMERQNNTLSR